MTAHIDEMAELREQLAEWQSTARDAAWNKMLLAARTRALGRVIREKDHLKAVVAKGAVYIRAGREVYKLAAQGDWPVRPSDIITTAEECDHE
ncbi:hypothetical protein GCM10027053_51750 [Intrasporangium mesophilum]